MDYSEKILTGLFLLCILAFFSWRNTCKSIVDEIGIVNVYYPEKYCKPSRLISKIFNLPNKVLPSVPRYIYVQQHITTVYPLFACAFAVLRLMHNISQKSAQRLLLFTVLAIILNDLCFYYFDFKWKRKKRAEAEKKC